MACIGMDLMVRGYSRTFATPVFLKNEIRLYYGGSDWLHTSWRNGFLCLATLRPDGFAGYEQDSKDRPAIKPCLFAEHRVNRLR